MPKTFKIWTLKTLPIANERRKNESRNIDGS